MFTFWTFHLWWNNNVCFYMFLSQDIQSDDVTSASPIPQTCENANSHTDAQVPPIPASAQHVQYKPLLSAFVAADSVKFPPWQLSEVSSSWLSSLVSEVSVQRTRKGLWMFSLSFKLCVSSSCSGSVPHLLRAGGQQTRSISQPVL